MILLNQFHQILTSLNVTLTVKEVVPKEANKPEMMNIFTCTKRNTYEEYVGQALDLKKISFNSSLTK